MTGETEQLVGRLRGSGGSTVVWYESKVRRHDGLVGEGVTKTEEEIHSQGRSEDGFSEGIVRRVRGRDRVSDLL